MISIVWYAYIASSKRAELGMNANEGIDVNEIEDIVFANKGSKRFE